MKRQRLYVRIGLTVAALGILCVNVHCDDGFSLGATGAAGNTTNDTIERIVQKIGINGGPTPVVGDEQDLLGGEGPVFETLPR